MGVSLVAAGGDAGLAVRALQRALGPRGLPLWTHAPQRAWVEAFPEGRSYVRRLATKNPYTCPVLGGDLNAVVLEGQLALARAFYRQGSFQEAADLFNKLLQNTAPTTVLLRGLGLSLARLGRYDQAYKHLRAPWNRSSRKTPSRPPISPFAARWAGRRSRRTSRRTWRGPCGCWPATPSPATPSTPASCPPFTPRRVHCNCRCRSRTRCSSATRWPPWRRSMRRRPQAYRHLAATFPEAVQPIHAWLYVRAASTLDLQSERDLDLFARTFANPAPARQYFTQRQWNFDDAEYTYLKRGAAVSPGRFPEALGADYPPQGEALSAGPLAHGGRSGSERCGAGSGRGIAAAGAAKPGGARPAGLSALPPGRHGPGGGAVGRLAVGSPRSIRGRSSAKPIIEQQRGNAACPFRSHRPGAGPDQGSAARRRGLPRRPTGDPGRIPPRGRRRSENKEHRFDAARPGRRWTTRRSCCRNASATTPITLTPCGAWQRFGRRRPIAQVWRPRRRRWTGPR